jgi:hypothetical protein
MKPEVADHVPGQRCVLMIGAARNRWFQELLTKMAYHLIRRSIQPSAKTEQLLELAERTPARLKLAKEPAQRVSADFS